MCGRGFLRDLSLSLLRASILGAHTLAYTHISCIALFFHASTLRCAVPLFDAADNKVYWLNNPAVSIPANIPSSILPWNVVPLPSLNTPSFPSIDNGDEWPAFSTWFHPNENALLNTTDLEGTSTCDGFPSYHQPIPHDEEGAPKGTFPTVFGRTPEGIDFAYDPHLALRENTVDSPLPDGGGRLVMATDGLTPGQGTPGEQVMCQNAERNFLNEDGCRLSYDTATCAPGEMPASVVELSESNVEGIASATGRDIYIAKDLDMAGLEHDASTGYDAPCGDGEQVSRWMMVEGGGGACDNTAGLGGGERRCPLLTSNRLAHPVKHSAHSLLPLSNTLHTRRGQKPSASSDPSSTHGPSPSRTTPRTSSTRASRIGVCSAPRRMRPRLSWAR